MSDNIVDKITNDDSKIVMTSRSVKWVFALLTTGVLGILGFAWGLYVNVQGQMSDMGDRMGNQMETNQIEVMSALDALKREEVKPNSDKNYKQDLDIVRLYERTNSRERNLNPTSRPEIMEESEGLPSIGQ
jgi:hypothetical protein